MWRPRRPGRWILLDGWLPGLLLALVLYPALVIAPDPTWWFLTVVFRFLAVLCAAAVPAILWRMLRWTRRALAHRRLLRRGVPVSARVTAARIWGHPVPTIDDIVLAELSVEIASEGAARILPVREWIDADRPPEVGDQAWVLVDPRHPDRCCLAPPDRYPGPALPAGGG